MAHNAKELAFGATRRGSRATKTRKKVLVVTELWRAIPGTVQPVAGIGRYAREQAPDWDLTVLPPQTLDDDRRVYRGIVGRITPEVAAFAKRAGIPAVNIWKSSPVRGLPLVTTDFEAAGRLAAEFLAERGFRRVAFLGADLAFSKPLGQGFMQAAEEHGMKAVTHQTKWFYDRTAETFNEFTKQTQGIVESLDPPVGMLVFDDVACRYIVQVCEKLGLSVPGDLGLVGVTNHALACMHPPPALTSIDLNLEMVGYRAAELLDAMMAGRSRAPTAITVPPLGIVPRRSTDLFVSDDETVARALQLIASRLSSPLRFSQIARQVAASERTLQRKFAETVGHSVAQEITLQRIRRAKQLLADTEKLIKQIARECGFPDAQQFCRTFLRIEGVSATVYRARYRT